MRLLIIIRSERSQKDLLVNPEIIELENDKIRNEISLIRNENARKTIRMNGWLGKHQD